MKSAPCPARPGERALKAERGAGGAGRGGAERRRLVSRKWSGKTLADHRADRKAWLLAALGTPAIDGPYAWEVVTPSAPDHMSLPRRLLHVLADRAHWQAALTEARRRAQDDGGDLPETGRAA